MQATDRPPLGRYRHIRAGDWSRCGVPGRLGDVDRGERAARPAARRPRLRWLATWIAPQVGAAVWQLGRCSPWEALSRIPKPGQGTRAYLPYRMVQPLIWLRYSGSAARGFGLHLASSDRYENQILSADTESTACGFMVLHTLSFTVTTTAEADGPPTPAAPRR
jgi:hypothetical protein